MRDIALAWSSALTPGRVGSTATYSHVSMRSV